MEQKVPAADRRHREIDDHEVRPVVLQVFQRELRMPGQEIARERMSLQECRVSNRLGVLHQRPRQRNLSSKPKR